MQLGPVELACAPKELKSSNQDGDSWIISWKKGGKMIFVGDAVQNVKVLCSLKFSAKNLLVSSQSSVLGFIISEEKELLQLWDMKNSKRLNG